MVNAVRYRNFFWFARKENNMKTGNDGVCVCVDVSGRVCPVTVYNRLLEALVWTWLGLLCSSRWGKGRGGRGGDEPQLSLSLYSLEGKH